MATVDWPLYEILLGGGASGLTNRDTAINDAVDTFASGMADDPAYQADATVNGESTPLLVNRDSSIQSTIKALPNTKIHIGDMIHCLGEEWIVVELYADKVGIINGTIWLCNRTISYQNFSPEIHTNYCVVDDGSYSKRSTDTDAYAMTSTYKIYISIDSNTEKLYVDKRLGLGAIFAPDGSNIMEVYEICGIDKISKNFGEGSHLMVMTAQRGVYRPETDDIALNLCDVYHPGDTTDISTESGSCVITGRDAIRIGTTRKYTAAFYDSASTLVSDAIPSWTVEIPQDSSVKYTINSDYTLSIVVPLEESELGGEIAISVKDSTDTYGSFEKKVRVIAVG